MKMLDNGRSFNRYTQKRRNAKVMVEQIAEALNRTTKQAIGVYCVRTIKLSSCNAELIIGINNRIATDKCPARNIC